MTVLPVYALITVEHRGDSLWDQAVTMPRAVIGELSVSVLGVTSELALGVTVVGLAYWELSMIDCPDQ